MRVQWREEALSLAMLAVMFVLAAVTWPTAPDLVPVHWTLAGEPDRFGGRFAGLVGLPLAAVGVYAALLLLPRIDPRRAHYEAFRATYVVIRTTIVGLLLAMYAFIHLWLRGATTQMHLFMPVLAGVVIMLLGNYLPKLRSNWFIGIRTPWTLTSEHSWRKTHQLAAWLFVAGGAMIIVVSILDPSKSRVVLFGTLMPTVLASVIYSYFAWRRDPDRTT